MGDVVAMGVLRGPVGLSGPGGALWPRIGGGARRCLFGAPDPEKTRSFLKSETERLESEGRAKWNFDFAAEKPLDGGRFAWIPSAGDDSKGVVESGDVHQTRITDFMRKRKLPSNPKDEPTASEEPQKKTRRRFST